MLGADLDDEESLGFVVRIEKIRIPITEAFHVEYGVRGSSEVGQTGVVWPKMTKGLMLLWE